MGSHTFPPSVVGFTSRARAYLNNGGAVQIIPTATVAMAYLDIATFDGSTELDLTHRSGTADATEANKLHDADGGFAAGDVNGYIWNTTDNTYSKITGFVDSGELDLANDIMVNGENYKLYRAKFTATSAGYYAIVINASVSMIDAKRCGFIIYKNGVQVHLTYFHGSHTAYIYGSAISLLYLAANDYIQFMLIQDTGVNQNVWYGDGYTNMAVHRLS